MRLDELFLRASSLRPGLGGSGAGCGGFSGQSTCSGCGAPAEAHTVVCDVDESASHLLFDRAADALLAARVSVTSMRSSPFAVGFIHAAGTCLRKMDLDDGWEALDSAMECAWSIASDCLT